MKRFIDKETGKEVNVLTEEEAMRIAMMYIDHCSGKEKMPSNREHLISFLYDFLVYGDDDDMENMTKALADIVNSKPEAERAIYVTVYNIFKKYQEFTKDDIKIVEATSYIFNMDNSKTVIDRKKANNEELDSNEKILSGLFDEGLDFSTFASHICEVWDRNVKEKLSKQGEEVDIPLDDELAYQDLLQFAQTGKLPQKAEYMVNYINVKSIKDDDYIEDKKKIEYKENYVENTDENSNNDYNEQEDKSTQEIEEYNNVEGIEDNLNIENTKSEIEDTQNIDDVQESQYTENMNNDSNNIDNVENMQEVQDNSSYDSSYSNYDNYNNEDSNKEQETSYDNVQENQIPTIEISIDDDNNYDQNNTEENNNVDIQNNSSVNETQQVQQEDNDYNKETIDNIIKDEQPQQNYQEQQSPSFDDDFGEIVLEDDGYVDPENTQDIDKSSDNSSSNQINDDMDSDMYDVDNMYNSAVEESRLSSDEDETDSFRD